MEAFVARVRALTDEERVAVARARKLVDESFHERAVLAGLEALAGRGEELLRARRALHGTQLPGPPDAAAGVRGHGDVGIDWNDVERHVQLAIDDALLAILGRAVLHPNHLRELYRSLGAAQTS